jgi:serine/threonine protein kinase
LLNIPKPKQKQHPPLSLSDFNLKAIKITEGGSIVYLASHKKTNCIMAIKSIKKRIIKPVIE